MTRPLPRRLDDLSVSARAFLEPSGNHCLEIMLDGAPVSILLGQQQARDVRRAIESFEREVIFRDGGPDLLCRVTKHLDIGAGQ